jgi:hypothetical protein
VRPASRRLLVFSKPARPGRVKTRLIGERLGELTAEQAAELHEAFTLDLLDRLAGGRFDLRVAWALEPGEEPPTWSPPWLRQEGPDLGARMHAALAGAAAEGCAAVAAVGTDHPLLGRAEVEDAFARVEAGAGAVFGPAADGGYYLVALAAGAALRPETFDGIAWSTPAVLAETLERCRRLGLAVELLAEGRDVDTPDDLAALPELVAGAAGAARTAALLARWGRPLRPRPPGPPATIAAK